MSKSQFNWFNLSYISISMTMIMSTTCTSPFVKDNEQPQYFKNDIRNSPFTAILMELAKEDNCDAMNSGINII